MSLKVVSILQVLTVYIGGGVGCLSSFLVCFVPYCFSTSSRSGFSANDNSPSKTNQMFSPCED